MITDAIGFFLCFFLSFFLVFNCLDLTNLLQKKIISGLKTNDLEIFDNLNKVKGGFNIRQTRQATKVKNLASIGLS